MTYEKDSANNMFTFILKADNYFALIVSYITYFPVLYLFCRPPLIPQLSTAPSLNTKKKDSIMCENLSKIDERIRKALEMYNEFIGHKSSGEVHTFYPELSRVCMPDISMPDQKTIKKSINRWLEELLCSSRNIEILAESSLGVIGKGDDDLRMREMTSEEGASLKKYTNRTQDVVMSLRRTLNVSYKTFTSFRFLKTTFFVFFILFYY
jgi:hypothetical protein